MTVSLLWCQHCEKDWPRVVEESWEALNDSLASRPTLSRDLASAPPFHILDVGNGSVPAPSSSLPQAPEISGERRESFQERALECELSSLLQDLSSVFWRHSLTESMRNLVGLALG